jgi:UPF0716 family protein affecting phage T7 exclusion
VLKQLVAFGAAWFVIAAALSAYRTRPFNARGFLGRSVLAWLFAVPAGIVLRAALLGQAAVLMLFVLAATAFGGLILLGWRAVYALIRVSADRRNAATNASAAMLDAKS